MKCWRLSREKEILTLISRQLLLPPVPKRKEGEGETKDKKGKRGSIIEEWEWDSAHQSGLGSPRRDKKGSSIRGVPGGEGGKVKKRRGIFLTERDKMPVNIRSAGTRTVHCSGPQTTHFLVCR